MDFKLKKTAFTINWRYLIITTLIASTTFEICAIIYTWIEAETGNAGLGYSWIWYFFAFSLIYIFLRVNEIDYRSFFISLVVLGWCSSLIWLFIPRQYHMPSLYAGVQTRLTLNEYQTSGGSLHRDDTFEYEHSLELEYVFAKNDPSFQRAIKDKAIWNEFVYYDSFIFWQTAMACGYNPERLKNYYGSNSIFGKLKLFLTVGPISIIECFIRGVYYDFLIFVLVNLIWFKNNRSILWE